MASLAAARIPVIGMRDSGVGGLTVAREVKKVLPQARLLYFADTAHVPYGGRPPAEVEFFALSISQFLLSQGAELLVFACNTTSAYALPEARRRFSQPVFGMIEPGAQAALTTTHNGRIGVLATAATVASGVFTGELQRQPGIVSYEIACPAFVPLVENEQTTSCEAIEAATQYLKPLLTAEVDTVILGCTHFPLLLPILQEIAPSINFVDPAQAVAQQVANQIASSAPHHFPTSPDTPTDLVFISGETDGVRHWVHQLLPTCPIEFHSGPIFEPSFYTTPQPY